MCQRTISKIRVSIRTRERKGFPPPVKRNWRERRARGDNLGQNVPRVPYPTREAGSQGRHGSEFRSVSPVKEIWTQKTKKEVSNEANLW